MEETKSNFFMREKPVFWLFLTVYFLLGLVFVFRSIVWTDESWYFGGSWLVANGMLPYRDFFIHHNPVFFYVYAIPQYLFGPNFIVGRLTSLLIMMLTFVLVWRLSLNLGGKTAAIITSGLLITNLYAIYYFTSFGYQVLQACLMILFFTILFGTQKDSIKYPLTTFLLCLVVGIRYPIDLISGLLVLYLIYIGYRNWKNKKVILLSLLVAALTLGVILLPFIALAKDQFFFDTVTYPFESLGLYIEFGLMEQPSIFARVVRSLFGLFGTFRNFHATVVILFGLLIYVFSKTLHQRIYLRELIYKNQNLIFLSTFIIFTEVFCAAAYFSAPFIRTFTFPVAAIVAGVGLSKVLAGFKDENAKILLCGLIIGLIILSPIGQDRESKPALTKNAEINYYTEVAARVADYTNERDKILTFTPIFALQADRELLHGTVMELYSFFPTWGTEKCKKYNLINTNILLDSISSKEAGAVVLTEERFFSGKYMSKILDDYRSEILQVLDENYYLAETLSHPPNIARGDVYIYLPRHSDTAIKEAKEQYA